MLLVTLGLCYKKPVSLLSARCPYITRVSRQRLYNGTSAANRSIGSTTGCTITEKASTRAFSWLKAPTSAFTFKTLLRHYAKQALTPQSLNVKLGLRHKSHKGDGFG